MEELHFINITQPSSDFGVLIVDIKSKEKVKFLQNPLEKSNLSIMVKKKKKPKNKRDKLWVEASEPHQKYSPQNCAVEATREELDS